MNTTCAHLYEQQSVDLPDGPATAMVCRDCGAVEPVNRPTKSVDFYMPIRPGEVFVNGIEQLWYDGNIRSMDVPPGTVFVDRHAQDWYDGKIMLKDVPPGTCFNAQIDLWPPA